MKNSFFKDKIFAFDKNKKIFYTWIHRDIIFMDYSTYCYYSMYTGRFYWRKKD